MNERTSGHRRAHLLLGCYVLVTLFALTWPGYDWLGNRIEPMILGLPFCFAYVVGWVVMSFIVLVFFHRSVSGGRL